MEWMRNLHHATFSTQDGWYRLEAPAGEGLVRISKGPEYTVKEAVVKINKAADDRSIYGGERMDWMLSHLYDMKLLAGTQEIYMFTAAIVTEKTLSLKSSNPCGPVV